MNKYGALLKGLLYCVPCNAAMVHTYAAKKNGRRFRYYVCLNAQLDALRSIIEQRDNASTSV